MTSDRAQVGRCLPLTSFSSVYTYYLLIYRLQGCLFLTFFMTSDPSTVISNPDDLTASASSSQSHLPRAKLTALARLKSFGGSFISSRDAPQPIVFPPPSWELSDDLLGKPAPRAPALLESNYSKADTPEAVPFAKKLRALIESLPISLPGTSSQHEAAGSGTADAPADAHEQDDERLSSPVPPDMDPSLVRMLSSEELMNGTPASAPSGPDSTPARPGVWNILASLRGGGAGRPRTSAVEEEEGGVMLYAPLEPHNDSQLALADSETVLEYADANAPRKSSEGAQPPRVAKHVWVPSTTELSVLTT